MKTFGIVLLVLGSILLAAVELVLTAGAIHEITVMLMIGFGCVIMCLADIRDAMRPAAAPAAPAASTVPEPAPSNGTLDRLSAVRFRDLSAEDQAERNARASR
jgi:hypothetical protein